MKILYLKLINRNIEHRLYNCKMAQINQDFKIDIEYLTSTGGF
jgi:hypothetical protein